MELFLEFVFTIVFSLLSSFFIARLVSLVSAHDSDEPDLMKRNHKCQDGFKDCNFRTEITSGFVSLVAGIDELGESMENNEILGQQDTKASQDVILKESDVFYLTEEGSVRPRELEIVDSKEEGREDGVECGRQESLFEESFKRETNMGSIHEEVKVEKSEESEMLKNEGACNNGEIDEEEDDDWEGIERSELERVFGAAVAFIGSTGNADDKKLSLSSDLKLQLYGLHQVAIEGPCLKPQPNALKVSARAKWNAWQQLGNMTSEAAMEQYINLVFKSIPGWMKGHLEENGKQNVVDDDASRNITSDLKPILRNQQAALVESRNWQLNS